MSREYNPITDAMSEQPEFVAEVTQATKRFFDSSDLEVLHSSKNREIKGYKDLDNMVVYLLDKQDKKINVNIDNIHDFNKKKSIKEIIYWEYKEKKGKVEENLHMHTVIECSLQKEEKLENKKDKLPKTEEEFEEVLRKKMPNSQDVADNFMKTIKSVYGEKFLSNADFMNSFSKAENQVMCSTDVGIIAQYTQLLNTKGYLAKVYPNEFFTNLNREAIPKYQRMLPDWIMGMNGMRKACEENKHTSKSKAFEFNDLDNHVWVKQEKLIVTSQNVGFYFYIKDDDNFTVYMLEKEYKSVDKEIKRIDNAVENKTINDLTDVVLKVENGKITNLNYSLMYCFELDMEYSVKAMKERGIYKVEYPVDLTSYQYQKDYYQHKYGYSEFEFVAQAMMTLGGGFDYDKEKGIFVDDGVKYIPNLPKAPDTRQEKFEDFNYLYPKKISHLNSDWLDGLKYTVEVLKRDRPKPVAYEGDDVEDALNKAIKYYEIKIAKLEQKENKPNI